MPRDKQSLSLQLSVVRMKMDKSAGFLNFSCIFVLLTILEGRCLKACGHAETKDR